MKIKKINVYNLIFHIFILICLIGFLVIILIWCANQIWLMQILKNQCIADCIEYNKINPMSCVC